LNEPAQSPGLRSTPDASVSEPLDIRALTRAMSKGNDMAYRTFYDAYFDRLLRYLLVVTRGDEEAAREALQQALVRVVRHIKVFQDEAAFWSWLTLLARSARSDETRKRRRYFAFLEKFTSHSEIAGDPLDDAGTTLRAALDRHLQSLPPDDRTLIEQKYFAHQSVRELAGEMQTTGKAIESRLSRVRRKLKEALLAELKNEQ